MASIAPSQDVIDRWEKVCLASAFWGALLPYRHLTPSRILVAVGLLQNQMEIHAFVMHTVPPEEKVMYEFKFKRMLPPSKPEHEWAIGVCSYAGRYTAKAFLKECLEPLGDTPLTRVVMNALSPYFEKGVWPSLCLA